MTETDPRTHIVITPIDKEVTMSMFLLLDDYARVLGNELDNNPIEVPATLTDGIIQIVNRDAGTGEPDPGLYVSTAIVQAVQTMVVYLGAMSPESREQLMKRCEAAVLRGEPNIRVEFPSEDAWH